MTDENWPSEGVVYTPTMIHQWQNGKAVVLIEAEKICVDELAADVTDWDRYADAWWRVQELTPERPKPDELIEYPNQAGPLNVICFVSGLIAIFYECFAASAVSPLVVTMAGVLVGLPAILAREALLPLYALCVAAMSLGFKQEANRLDSQTQKVRVVQIATAHRLCLVENQRRVIFKLPLVNCRQSVLR